MKSAYLIVFCAATLLGQTASNLPPETVIAEVEGRKLTVADMQRVMGMLPKEMQGNLLKDRKAFVRQYALMLRLSDLARQNKLDQQSPYKEMIEAQTNNILTSAQLTDVMNSFPVTPEEQKGYYEAHPEAYSHVKLKGIYIPFVSNPVAAGDSKGKKALSEAEAKAKAEKLLAEIRAGADFVKLVREHSQDETSVKKDGDFGSVRQSDKLPDAVRAAVFKLKAGEVTDPVRQPNGFYLFKAEEAGLRPYDEVKDDAYQQVKNIRMKEWMDKTNASLKIKFENEAFFEAPAPAADKRR